MRIRSEVEFLIHFYQNSFKSQDYGIYVLLQTSIFAVNQVRYAYKSFCHFTPGTVLMALHGSQKQAKRFETFENFSKKTSCVLFATDLAARGLGNYLC